MPSMSHSGADGHLEATRKKFHCLPKSLKSNTLLFSRKITFPHSRFSAYPHSRFSAKLFSSKSGFTENHFVDETLLGLIISRHLGRHAGHDLYHTTLEADGSGVILRVGLAGRVLARCSVCLTCGFIAPYLEASELDKLRAWKRKARKAKQHASSAHDHSEKTPFKTLMS
jgi:hypothetical protein